MTEILHKKWFKPVFFALLFLLQFSLLFTAAFLRPAFSEAENAYIALVRDPAAGRNPDALFTPADVLRNCTSQGVPPLYPLLLRFAYTCCAPFAAPAILNLLFFAATWIILYFASRSLISDRWEAALTPFLCGFTAGAALAVRTCGPCMLTMLFTALMLFFLIALQRNPRGKLLHVGLFLTVLGGFLTLYEFLILAIVISAVYLCHCVIHRRYSDMATTFITIATAALTAVIFYPAAIEHIITHQASLTLPYTERLAFLYKALSDTLFGGLLTPILLLLGLLLTAAAFFHATLKKAEPTVTTPSIQRKDTEGIAATSTPPAQDPAEAAYRRRIARRTEKTRKLHVPLPGKATSLLFLIGCVVLLSFLLLPLSYRMSTSFYPFIGESIPSGGLMELSYLLQPLLIFLFTNFFYRCIPAIGGNHKAVLLITAGFFLALSMISFVICQIFSQPMTAWLLSA